MQTGRRLMNRFSPNPNLSHLIHWTESEEDAFRKAREQDRPVMLFLAAFWCRYCQRMDEGAFSDRENMALLNAYFVSLRVENAKRPDIDARYNLNGWPTIAFLTPNGKLLAAANYLPSDEFKEFLLNVYMEYEQRKDELRLSDGIETVAMPAIQRAERALPSISSLRQIANSILALADPMNGGYGNGQKFIHAEANEFLLACYEATKDSRCLDHARLTLERMRAGPVYDQKEDGYFRTTTGADWTQPHREKLLAEQAGLLGNCLRLFRITQRPEYARMAEEIIGYLDTKLFDASKPAFFGCEDFLRRDEDARTDEFFTIIDDCVYTDANAQAIVAYLEAGAILNRPDHKTRALNVLDFLWRRNRSEHSGMFHYSDDASHARGLLSDQARMGIALVQAYRASNEVSFLERAKELAEFILLHLSNPGGGYFDRGKSALEFFGSRLSLIDQNGTTASFFLMLADVTKEQKHRDGALSALAAFSGDFAAYGLDAAPYGQALGEWLSRG
ncbi:MAG: thioredoxin domain-containing protein [Deltaproteobacteria bacterium]|nr:MAG: thioredoxin domain-containing protein [Deltaproteobacteria bacterium]